MAGSSRTSDAPRSIRIEAARRRLALLDRAGARTLRLRRIELGLCGVAVAPQVARAASQFAAGQPTDAANAVQRSR
jgi:hypothetical protein